MKRERGGELSDLESVPSSILQIFHPDIIDSQTLHSDGKFELPLGNKYFDFARCNFPSCWCTSSEVAFLETGRCSPRSWSSSPSSWSLSPSSPLPSSWSTSALPSLSPSLSSSPPSSPSLESYKHKNNHKYAKYNREIQTIDIDIIYALNEICFKLME